MLYQHHGYGIYWLNILYTNTIAMTEVLNVTLLAIAAFGLGACPFSVWVGRWFLGKDIRDYGDGNPRRS